MMTEFYPAPPGVLMAGATIAFCLAWALLLMFSRLLGAPGLARDRTVTVVGMLFVLVYVVTFAALSVLVPVIWLNLVSTTVLVAIAGSVLLTMLGCLPFMRRA
jgi:hypothetical protein